MIRLALVLLSVPFASTTESSKAIKDWRASGTVALKDWRAGAVRLMGYVDEGLAGPSMAAARWREKKEQRRNDFTVSDVEDDCAITTKKVQGGTLCISPPMDLHAAPVPLSSLPIEWALRIPPVASA